MPGLPCSFGDVIRLDLPTPFFLREVSMQEFIEDDYSWVAQHKVIVLVKKNKNYNQKMQVLPAIAQVNPDDSIGGCPLECPFDPNENFEEAVKLINSHQSAFNVLEFPLDEFEPMDLPTSRGVVKKLYEGDANILQDLCLDRFPGKQNYASPIFIACEGSPTVKDPVLIGFNKEKFFEVRMMGPFSRESPQLSIELMLAYHQRVPNVNPTVVQRQVHAVYEKVHGEHISQGKVYMEFYWNDPKVLFEPPPASYARAKLAIKPQPGDANPQLLQLWEELMILEKLIDMYKDGEDFNSSTLSASFASQESSPLTIAIKSLLDKPSGPAWKKGCMEYSDSLENALMKVVAMNRSNVDFVDKVWELLKLNCTASATELMEFFRLMFKAVDSKMYRPYLLPSNCSLLCEFLKGIMSNKITNYRAQMNVKFVLELAIDCGLHKLFKDYTYALETAHLAETRIVRSFLPQSQFQKQSLHSLKKLHCIVEILSLSYERLPLSVSELEHQSRKLFDYFTNHPLDWNKIYHFDISMNSVANCVQALNPVFWNLKLESQSSLRISRTSAILARDFFVGHARKFYTTADGTIPRGYYLYIHRVAQRKM